MSFLNKSGKIWFERCLAIISVALLMLITALCHELNSYITLFYALPLLTLSFVCELQGVIIGFIAIALSRFFLLANFDLNHLPTMELISLFLSAFFVSLLHNFFSEQSKKLAILNSLLENIHIGVLISEGNRVIYARNSIATKLLNLDNRSEKANFELLKEYGLAELIKKVLREKNDISHPLFINGLALMVYMSFHTCIFDQKPMAVTTIIDRTEEERLRQLKGDMIDFATHQVNAPLTAINNYAEILAEKDVRANQIRDRIIKNVSQISFAIQNIPDIYTLADSYELSETLSVEDVSATALIDSIINPLTSLFEQKSLKIEREELENVMLSIDRRHTEFVFTCIMHNAIKYSSKGGVISLFCKKVKDGERCEIKIINSCDDLMVNIENIFTKGVIGTRGHTGLGLPYAKSVILAHDGDIAAHMEDGIFILTITLPLHRAEEVSYKTATLADKLKSTDNPYSLEKLQVAENAKNIYNKKEKNDG